MLILPAFAIALAMAFSVDNNATYPKKTVSKKNAVIGCSPDWNLLNAWIDEVEIPPLPGSGNLKWAIDTRHDSAQFYFNQGINTYYGFHIIEAKASFKKVSWLIRNRKFDSIDLIIGSVKEPEFGVLSKFAGQRKIPFISSTYPNDGGIRNNGYVTILNSTLKSHCEGIFSYLVQKHGTDNIYLIKKKNDNRVDNYFKALNSAEGQPLLKMKTIMLDSSISAYGLKNLIDTTRPAVIIGASLDETFSIKLAEACYPVSKTNTLSLIGMPNWDGFRGFYKKDAFKDFPIKFTTPHYDAKAKEFTQFLSEKYFKLYRADPTDMAYKGFESAYYFTRILLKYNKQFMDKLNEPSLAPFHDFNLRPVYFNKESTMPDYYENKQLFIMQILNGHIVRQW